MYACLHNSHGLSQLKELTAVALHFSPQVEATSEDTVVFSIAPLRKLLGSPYQIASEICRRGHEHKLQANLAIASNPDAAILLARNLRGVTLVTPGEERFKLAPLPLSCLFMHTALGNSRILETLQKWGLRTCGDLADLDPIGIAERLGPEGIHLRNLACGMLHRPLQLPSTPTSYEEAMDLEHPLSLLEPLLFLLGSALRELCSKLRSQSMAARLLKLHFRLEEKKEYHCELEFPVPLQETRTLLKLLQLHLERHPPEAAVIAFHLTIEPATPKRIQSGFFLPPVPLADKLQLTLARIRGMVGRENVITPQLLNTHRPDAFQAAELNTEPDTSQSNPPGNQEDSGILRLAIRLFRPPLEARVHVAKQLPRKVQSASVKGTVLHSAGPWKTSGEWWTQTSWSREEWDVALDDGGLYRIYQENQTQQWYVQGIYD